MTASKEVELVSLNYNSSYMQYHVESRNAASTRQWTRSSELTTQQEQVEFFKNSTDQWFWLYENNYVGTAGLTNIRRRDGTAEFSLLIKDDLRGYGYGTEALQQLLNYAFINQNFRIIYGETFVYPQEAEGFSKVPYPGGMGWINPAWKIFHKLGARIDGRLKERYYKFGYYVDSMCFHFRREDWKSSSVL